MSWLIDISLWIAVERGALAAADIHAITRQEPIYLSPVNLADIRFGLDLLTNGLLKQRAVAMLRRLRRKPQLRITVETGETFGMLAAKAPFSVISVCARRTRRTLPTFPDCRWSS